MRISFLAALATCSGIACSGGSESPSSATPPGLPPTSTSKTAPTAIATSGPKSLAEPTAPLAPAGARDAGLAADSHLSAGGDAAPGWTPFDRSQLATTVEPCVGHEGTHLKCVARVVTGHRPKSLAFSPDGSELWVALHYDRPAVAVYDTRTWALIGAVELGRYGTVELAFSPSGERVYFSQLETAVVQDIDRATRRLVRTLKTGSEESKFIAVSASGTTLWVSNWKGHSVSEFDLATGELRRRLKTPGIPRGLWVSGDQQTLYVAGFSPGRLYRFDLTNGKRTIVTEKGGIHRHLVADEARGRLYISDLRRDRIWVLDLATDDFQLLAKVDQNPNTIALAPDGKVLYVSNRGKNHPETFLKIGPEWGSILAIDAATGRLLDAVVTGNQATGLDVSPDGRLLAGSDFLDNRINVYQLPTTEVLLASEGVNRARHRSRRKKKRGRWGRKARRDRTLFRQLSPAK